MQVFHGSYTKIDTVDLSKCAPNKDFGQGFYVTKFRHHAESWAKVIGKKHKTEGAITEFLFYDSPFTEHLCKVKHFDQYNEEWLDFVVANRNPMMPMHDFDIVEGPVANDKVQNRINDFLRGYINKSDFLNELKYHEETHQICFCTLKSLLTLKPVNSDVISNIMHIGEPLITQLMADNQIDEANATDLFYTSITFGKLADENTQFYRKSWQEIYEILKTELKKNRK
jgi:hypothetical protein